MQIPGNTAGHLTACHFPEEPTTDAAARTEDIVMDTALRAMEAAPGETAKTS